MGSLRHRLFRWGTAFLAPPLAVAVLVLGSKSTRATDPSGLPRVGAALSSGIPAARFDSIAQTLIFVSDNCGLCRARAASYIRHLQQNHQTVLIVASSEGDPVFSPLAEQHPERIAAGFRLALACAGMVSLLALPGAVLGFAGCDCPACRQVGSNCYEWDKCPNGICNWNGPECDCGCPEGDC